MILTSGGCSYRELGATGKGFDLTRTLGHRIEPLLPALVPLLVVEAWPKACAGINLDAVELWIDLPKLRQQRVRGEFLFTHRGISGPAALDLSGSVAAALAAGGSVPLRLNCFPDTGAATWQQRLDAGRREHGARLVRNLLDDFLPAGLATAWADAAGAASTTAARLDRTQQQRLLELLAAAPLTVTGTEGFARAMVTRGGVALREIVPETLESRICPRLFFAGEVVDLDGPCGGFNLQWAFASGCLAGRAALAK